MRLDGQVAIVTGASRGIGKGIAQRLATEGAKVAITARGTEALLEAARGIEAAGGTVLPIPGDAGVKANVEAMFKQVLDTWGSVSILVNNAAWASPQAHILEMDEEHWDTVIQSNLKSVYLHCHRMANILVDQGTRGSIVNISSFAAARAHRNMAAYDATKGGMEAMSRTMAIDLAPFGIRVNVVGPAPSTPRSTSPLARRPSCVAARRCRSGGSATRRTLPERSPFWPPRTPATSPARCCMSTAACSPNSAHRRLTLRCRTR